MAFGTHVFISYAHYDNDALTGAWVTHFHELLEAYLKQTLRRTKPIIWRDKRLSDNENFDNSIIENLADSAVMVAILTDNYVESPWCQREAREFCEKASRSIGLEPNNLLRIFKVVKAPPENEDTLPEPVQRYKGTRFFVRMDKNGNVTNDENDYVQELKPTADDALGQKLHLKINQLAQDISKTLKAVASSNDAGASDAASGPTKPTVYLAECGDDRLDDQAALRSELLQRGYTVVPSGVLPPVEEDCRAEVQRLLDRSDLSVHLLGTRSGTVPGGEGADSVVAIQNELAVKRAASAPLKRVVSLPAGAVDAAIGERHKNFLAEMHSSLDLQGGCELITADLESVKSAMHSALRSIESAPESVETPPPDALRSIYVIFDRPDLGDSKPLRRALEAHATVLKPAFTGDPASVREANLQNLAACDGVIIFYGCGSDGWKAAVDGDLLRARALRGRPFELEITWLAGETTDDKDDLVGDPGVIDARGNFSQALLEPVVQALKEIGDE